MKFSDSAIELNDVIQKMCSTGFDEKIDSVASALANAFSRRNKLLLAGNGGSAAEAQHMAAEYVATLKSKNFRRGLPALALTVDTSFLSAWTNDFGVDCLFSRQVEVFGLRGDVLFAYSTSGTSKNILNAVEAGKKNGMFIVGFTSDQGRTLASLCDECFMVPTLNTARAQEVHTLIGHTLCALTEQKLGFKFDD